MSFFQSKAKSLVSGKDNGKDDPNLPPVPIHGASNPETLLAMLLEMYWGGVYMEIKYILLSLIEARRLRFSEIEKERKVDGEVAGYDAFIDQICEEPNGDIDVKQMMEFEQGGPHQPIHPLRTRAPEKSKAFREAVAATLQEQERDHEDSLHFRVRIMLQGAGLLDIDKLVEYKKPDERFNIVRKGKVPQLKVDYFEENGIPRLAPARCKFCRDILRGVLFKCKMTPCPSDPFLTPLDYFCEDCFHNGNHPQVHLIKMYKHCILDEAITSDTSRRLCACTTVPRFDHNGEPNILYPIDPMMKHRQSANGYSKCRLFLLPGLVGEEKYRWLAESMESRRHKLKGPLKIMTRSSRPVHEPVYDLQGRLEEMVDSDLPWALRPVANKFPFGNTHVSLMVGPLIIENGHTRTKYQGALITKRDPLNYHVRPNPDDALPDSVLVGYTSERNYAHHIRQIFTQDRRHRTSRRLKACMKQVVGGAFSGYFSQTLEREIVDQLIASTASSSKEEIKKLVQVRKATEAVMPKLKALLGSRIHTVLATLARRLFDPSIEIEWDFFTNNCQYFTDAILPFSSFGALFGNSACITGQPTPYLMSFVVRIQSYDKAPIITKYDIPNGQTEEYLLEFHSGRHDDSDIVDTLQEYWHDWGAFGGPLYKNQQHHFPWDCTEAYKISAPTCNNCSLSRHVWAFPFDSWSIIQLSLQKDDRGLALTRKEWLENRFQLFVAQDSLIRGALAMSRTKELREATTWFHSSASPRYDRLKLGGIHRAQPYSHHFEAGRHNIPYLAPWAHFTLPYRVQEYEKMRLAQQRKTEVTPTEAESEESESSTRLWWEAVKDLSVPIAIAAVSLDALHLGNTPVMAVGALPPDPAALAALADLMAPLTDGIGQVGNILGNIN